MWNRESPMVRGLLPLVMVSTVARQLGDQAWLGWPGHVALLLYLISEWPRLGGIPRGLLVAAGLVLGACLVWMPAPAAVLLQGLDRAAGFATFLAALSFLREAADRSPLVRDCGQAILHQPPSRRYLTLSCGALLIGVLLNMAVISLLGVMARRANTLAAAGGDVQRQALRTRRMFTAITRGFSTSPLGSPLTMTMAVTLALLPQLSWWKIWPLGLGATLLLMALGTVLDRLQTPAPAAAVEPMSWTPSRPGRRPILRFLLLVLAVFLAAVVLDLWLQHSLTLAIMLVAPVAAGFWLSCQYWRPGRGVLAPQLAAQRLRRGAGEQFSRLRAETAVLSAGALMGTLLAAAMPVEMLHAGITTLGLKGLTMAWAVLLTMVVLPQLGLNPVLVATLILTLLSRSESFGLSAELLALSVASGWALSVTCSPIASTVLIACPLAGTSPQRLGWGWNGLYVLCGVPLCALWLWLLASWGV